MQPKTSEPVYGVLDQTLPTPVATEPGVATIVADQVVETGKAWTVHGPVLVQKHQSGNVTQVPIREMPKQVGRLKPAELQALLSIREVVKVIETKNPQRNIPPIREELLSFMTKQQLKDLEHASWLHSFLIPLEGRGGRLAYYFTEAAHLLFREIDAKQSAEVQNAQAVGSPAVDGRGTEANPAVE